MVERVEQQAFLRDLQDALDMGETEADALEVTAKALRDAAPGPGRAPRRRRQPRPPPPGRRRAPGSERAGLRRRDAVGLPRRPPGPHPLLREQRRPLGLPAPVRTAAGEPCSAVCVPITILGTPDRRHPRHRTRRAATAGPPRSTDRLEGVAAQVGTRLGVLRAMAKSQLQAETDPLTGLLNRRAMEERVRHLREAGTPVRARPWPTSTTSSASTTATATTPATAPCAPSPGCSARPCATTTSWPATAARSSWWCCPASTPSRPRRCCTGSANASLDAVGTALIPEFSVSIGLADSTWSSDLTDVLRAADHALMEAKAQGRDRLVIADPPAPGGIVPGPPVPAPEPA